MLSTVDESGERDDSSRKIPNARDRAVNTVLVC